MSVGVVDIGTNSMRLLITDGRTESGRWVEVTGLGRGVDSTGRLGDAEMERTVAVLERFGRLMTDHEVELRGAMATSATRDASNRAEFMGRVGEALGVMPEVIGGQREGELAYAGATADLGDDGYLVSDIGGGSTEFVTADGALSIDIGSIRLSDRILTDRPPGREQMERAREHVLDLFSGLDVAGELVGVAGSWTNLASMDLDLPAYDRERIHLHRIPAESVTRIIERLAGLTVEETEAIPSLDPGRAPMILAGAVIAGCVMESVAAPHVIVSERDTLDGLAMELLGLT